MNSKRKSQSLPHESLRLIAYCPLCEAPFNPLRARLLEEQDGAQLMHIECAKCSGAMVALIMSSPLGITSFSLLTDLTSEDVIHFKDETALSADEVLAFHGLLHKNSISAKINRAEV